MISPWGPLDCAIWVGCIANSFPTYTVVWAQLTPNNRAIQFRLLSYCVPLALCSPHVYKIWYALTNTIIILLLHRTRYIAKLQQVMSPAL